MFVLVFRRVLVSFNTFLDAKLLGTKLATEFARDARPAQHTARKGDAHCTQHATNNSTTSPGCLRWHRVSDIIGADSSRAKQVR